MRIGILGLGDQYSIATAIAGAAATAEDGFDAYWLPGEVDPISTIVAVGREVRRLILGVGLSHRSIVLTKWGQPFDRPVRYLREYLEILVPLLDSGTVDFQGELLSARTTIRVDGAIRPPLLVAAMGPQTLRVAGRYADGTDTWMTGPKTLAALTVPTISEAAAMVGKPPPRIAAGMIVCVTGEEIAARDRAAREFAPHSEFPTYRAMLDREGKQGPADIAIIGRGAAVRAAVLGYRDAGVTDFIASPFGNPEERLETRAVLRALASEIAKSSPMS
ncbi:MAG: LLM class flavin-dependent oxidoreductase [Actinobacteria bacterium]|nr:MAG: LLM class flavin-dependent oxidoreductase [Actinomycetota bacterium]